MNRYMKLYALLGAVCLLGACHDDFGNEGGIKVIPGEEIQFGATAHFEDGDNTTRTVYGDIVGNQIEVNWVAGEDRIQIASPHTTGVDVAEYTVTGASDADLANGKDKSTATTLQRIGEAGLQWTNEEKYEFYAMYPSHNQLKEVVTEVEDTETYGLKTSYDEQGNPVGTMVGYLPVVQDPKDLNGLSFTNNVCVIEPDMRFAYMVAKEHYTVPKDGVIDTVTEKIQLNFSSLVTALQFDITANTIGHNNSSGSIRVTDLTLYSHSGKDICGKFEYTFPKGEEETVSDGDFKTDNSTSGYSRVSMSFGQGIPLVEGQAIEATFFLLPSVEKYTRGDLKLIIHYVVNEKHVQTKTATINKDLMPRKKYYFKDMLLPPISTNVEASVWFQALEPQILASQVSFPVAGNVFASKLYGAPENNYQQSAKLEDLWNMGVRGFEIVTQSANADPTGSLKECQVMAAEEFCTGSGAYTFHKAFDELVAKLKEYPEETLVILATYMAKNDGYNPYAYISNLFNYLEWYVKNNARDIGQEDFVQLTETSTVANLQGKIAIIVRPGDDERWLYETADKYSPYTILGVDKPDNGLTCQIPNVEAIKENTWWNNVVCIWDWGTASYDVWDRRYGSSYARAATFYDMAESRKIGNLKEKAQIEKYLYASNRTADAVGATDFTHSGNSNDNNFNNYGADPTKMPPLSATGFNYEHALSNRGKAFVQEWMRVIPDGGIGPICVVQNKQSWTNWTPDYSIWAKWPSSIQEKKDAIKTLFNQSVLTKGEGSGNLYINVLSGYYATPNVNVSLLPFKSSVLISSQNDYYKFTNPGKGGDFQNLAYDLNTYVYNLLSAKPGVNTEGDNTERLTQDGPWGLVVMDHIGNPISGKTDYSVHLVNLIMMNNFKFPLATKQNGDTPPPPATRDVAVSFSNDPADPSGAIY